MRYELGICGGEEFDELEEGEFFGFCFCGLLEENADANPKYQREGGDWLNWTVPGTWSAFPIFASGWDDGVYPVYYGRGSIVFCRQSRYRIGV